MLVKDKIDEFITKVPTRFQNSITNKCCLFFENCYENRYTLEWKDKKHPTLFDSFSNKRTRLDKMPISTAIAHIDYNFTFSGEFEDETEEDLEIFYQNTVVPIMAKMLS
jgi:hypothetical protein